MWNGRHLAFRHEDDSLRIVPLDGRAPITIDDREGGLCFLPDGGWLPLPDQAISAVAFRGNALWCTVLGGEMLTRLDVSGLPPLAKSPNRRP